MSFRMKTLTPISYCLKVNAIKKKLARYKDHDFLRNFYRHFHSFRDEKTEIISNFPWCCFLALKWKFSSPKNRSVESMSYHEFVIIINRIYDLQTEASNLNAESNVILGVRRMMINQFLYQHSNKFNYASLIRQHIGIVKANLISKKNFIKSLALN